MFYRCAGGIPRLKPLVDDQEVHISKEESKEEYLWDELKDNLKIPFEVDCVEALHYDTQQHMDDCNNNCDLHLQTIHEHQLICCYSPNRVNSKWIHAVLNHLVPLTTIILLDDVIA